MSYYKNTIFLPKTLFPIRIDLIKQELLILDSWVQNDLYKKIRQKSKFLPKFILHDGPPYANGSAHLGHALNRILKDFIIRSRTMMGFDAPFFPGWDCHGLPIEWKVEENYKKINISKKNISINTFRKLPNVKTLYYKKKINLTIIRENIEDLYSGIEYSQTLQVNEALKITSVEGCEKIIKLSFEYAKSQKIKKIHCVTKANIMKLTDGLMKKIFFNIAKKYKNIEPIHMLIDNCAHQMVTKPEQFELIVTNNMNGDILSDLGSGLVGGLGFAPSVNLGEDIAIFEAVHGSAPDIVGKNIANPISIILSSIMMLEYIEEVKAAKIIEKALIKTIQEFKEPFEQKKFNTNKFTEKIIFNLDKNSETNTTIKNKSFKVKKYYSKKEKQKIIYNIIGVDIFLQSNKKTKEIVQKIKNIIKNTCLYLYGVKNNGIKIFPETNLQKTITDSWQCRFYHKQKNTHLNEITIIKLIEIINDNYNWSSIKKLYVIKHKRLYSEF